MCYCYHGIFGCSATKGVRTNIRKLRNWGALGPSALGGAWLSSKNKPPPQKKKCSSASKCIRIYRRSSQNWGALEPGPLAVRAWLILEIRRPPRVWGRGDQIPAEFGRSTSTVRALLSRFACKI